MIRDPDRTYVPDRRRADRFPGSKFELEILVDKRARQAPDANAGHNVYSIGNLSLAGIYFRSERRRRVGSKFKFRVLFDDEHRNETLPLFSGSAKVLRCEDVNSVEEPYGIAAEIESIRGAANSVPRFPNL
ncbi:MAG TPA: hypothetical protein VMB47_05395 [Candidatus Aquilonibacter sp.]|nr:hypothetical protein [Candidatus Aquilonibacter sp.]